MYCTRAKLKYIKSNTKYKMSIFLHFNEQKNNVALNWTTTMRYWVFPVIVWTVFIEHSDRKLLNKSYLKDYWKGINLYKKKTIIINPNHSWTRIKSVKIYIYSQRNMHHHKKKMY